jgi:glycogen branching enzyme (EC 2.4.1.18)
MGDFNNWDVRENPMNVRWDSSGIWETFVPGVKKGAIYKYHIVSKYSGYEVDKGDPFAFMWEDPPRTASVVWDTGYEWLDYKSINAPKKPMSIYEVHPGSWKKVPEEKNRYLSYMEIARDLPDYVKDMGYTHVEFLPMMEYPFYGSWGYQTVGYFAPTSRHGKLQDFMHLIDAFHQRGIGVLLDWVPSHFPSDEHGLVFFDGTHLYEHEDPRKGMHPDWNTCIFNYSRNEVRSFLISSAIFWLEKYRVDGLRVDAVASLLYLDYSRKEGEWIPNEYGGRENLEAISFLRRMNEEIHGSFPDSLTIAEESTAWPMVSRPTYDGGLGFDMKWNMGWMHDTLNYFSKNSIYRKYEHDKFTFSIWYAFSENFVLPLSHDEVVHGKGSLLGKMPGSDMEKFANLRLLFGYMFAHPGKKLLFMGNELAPWREWDHDESLDWHLLKYVPHEGIRRWVRDLNNTYGREAALQKDFEPGGFRWIDFGDWEGSVISFLRRSENEEILVVCNFTPVPRHSYRIGTIARGFWNEILNSDFEYYGGSGMGNLGGVEASPHPFGDMECSLSLTLPPLSIVFFKKEV